MRKLLACLALVACSKPSNDTPATATPAPSASVAAVTAKAARQPTPRDDARDAVLRWSDAMDRHDLAALEKVYAPKVDLYGREVARAAALDAKRSAFKATPDFKQSITGPIALEKKGGEWIATFTKHSGAAGKEKDASAKVVLGPDLAVKVETDTASEAKVLAAGSCESVVEKTVSDLPQVKKLLADDQKALGKNDHLGGMGPDKDEGGGFSGALGVHHPDRFESQVVYTVEKGKLTVTVMGDDIAVPPPAAAAVAKACP